MLMSVKDIWDDTYPDASFDTFMLEEKYEAENLKDQYFGKLFSFATVLSIIISCMGLLGLSLLISTKRLKEIAIRKTFGASSASILINFVKGYTISLVASTLIGSSLAYFLMTEWLKSYAYRIQLQLDLILFCVSAVVAVFLFTISYHTIRSSVQNPVDILKE
jgi:putative ABC transport system permease protein